MNLDGAQNAKAEVFEQVFGFAEVASTFSEGATLPSFTARAETEVERRIASGRRSGRLDPADRIAVGFARDPDAPRNVQLALLLQNEALRHHPIVERVQHRIGHRETQIIITGPARVQVPVNGGRCRPLRLGASIGHVNVTAGSIGCFVTCRSSQAVGVLSNNHVLADSNAGASGDIILQPASKDGGSHTDGTTHVAALTRFERIDFASEAVNYVDCAFAQLNADITYHGHHLIDPLGIVADGVLSDIEDLILDNTRVSKLGRTTGHTHGTISVASLDNTVVKYPGHGFARFDRQVAIRGANGAFSAGGDSGSLVVTDERRPVALLFAGTPSGTSYANPLQTVLDTLSVDLHLRP